MSAELREGLPEPEDAPWDAPAEPVDAPSRRSDAARPPPRRRRILAAALVVVAVVVGALVTERATRTPDPPPADPPGVTAAPAPSRAEPRILGSVARGADDILFTPGGRLLSVRGLGISEVDVPGFGPAREVTRWESFIADDAALLPDGRRVVAIDDDRLVTVDPLTHEELSTTGVGGGWSVVLAGPGDRVVLLGDDGVEVREPDGRLRRIDVQVQNAADADWAVASTDGRRVLALQLAYPWAPTGPGVVTVDPGAGTVVGRTAVAGRPYAIAVTPDGARAFVAVDGRDAGLGSSVLVVDTGTGMPVAQVPIGDGRGDAPVDVAVTPDGRWLYAVVQGALVGAAPSSELHLFDARTLAPATRVVLPPESRVSWSGRPAAVDAVAFAPDGRRVVVHGEQSYGPLVVLDRGDY